ncbi:MAG: hypothetical protein JXA96_10070 [Sedimentisphaerales bacterium]|nr:hypothetical protein [Sedimentisphaerales bacterium]
MKPVRDIRRLIMRLHIIPSAKMHRETLNDVLEAQEEIKRDNSGVTCLYIGRLIMKSKITKYSAAAVVTLAIVFVLLNPFICFQYGNIVWADIPQKVTDAETMIVKGTKIFKHPGDNGEVFVFDGLKGQFDLIKYFSKQYGFVEEGYSENNLVYRITFNLPQRQTLILLTPYKKYLKYDLKDELIQMLKNLTPVNMINLLLQNGYEELGTSIIEGVDVDGYAYHDKERFLKIFPKLVCDIKNANGKVWVEVNGQLPIKFENDFLVGKSFLTMFNDLEISEVNYLSDFNIDLDEKIFNIDTPSDYSEIALVDILPLIPTSVKASVAGAGLGIILIPTGIISWRRHNRKKRAQTQKK